MSTRENMRLIARAPLLMKPRFFSGFLGKFFFVCILKDISPFKMHKLTFFSKKMLTQSKESNQTKNQKGTGPFT